MPSRNELQPDLSTLHPVSNAVAPPSAPAQPDAAPKGNPQIRTTLAPMQQMQPDQQRQFFKGGVPQLRISPLPTTAQASINASATGVAKTIVAAAPTTSSGGGISSVALTVPSILTVSGSPVVPPGGTFAVDVASEPANTFWGGPTAAGSPLEGILSLGKETSGSTGTYNLSVTPTTATSWALFTGWYAFSGSASFPPDTGWTRQGGATLYQNVFTKSFTGATPASFSIGMAANSTVVGNTLLFNGAMPTIVQQNSRQWGGGTSETLAFSGSNTVGNMLVVTVATNNSVFGSLSISATDSNGNVYQTLSNLQYGGNWQNSLLVLVCPSCAGGANTITYKITGTQGGGRDGAINVFEFSPTGAGAGTPFFRNLVPGDIPAINLSGTGNGGVTGTLPVGEGGTGANLRQTGGTSQVLKQTAAGAAVTVGQLGFTDLSGSVSTAASVALTAQTATIAATNLFTPTAAVLYQVNYYLNTTTAGSAGTVSLTLTWNNGASQTFTSSTANLATLGNTASGTFLIKATSGTPQYSTTVTGATGSPQYSLDIRVVPLG